MVVERKFKQSNSEWRVVETLEAIARLSRYFKKTDIIERLKNGEEVSSPFAVYRMKGTQRIKK